MEKTQSSVGRAACSIFSTIRSVQSAAIRNNSLVLSGITSIALYFRNRYLESFETNQKDDEPLYITLHNEGNRIIRCAIQKLAFRSSADRVALPRVPTSIAGNGVR